MKRQGGFGVIEIILVVVMVAAVGGLGYQQWRLRQAAKIDEGIKIGAGQDLVDNVPAIPDINVGSDLDAAANVLDKLDFDLAVNQSQQLDSDAQLR